MKHLIGITLIAACVPALSPAGGRADVLSEPKSTYWQGKPCWPGDWFVATNWTAGVPGAGTWAYVDNGGTAVIQWHTTDGTNSGGGTGPIIPAVAGMLYIGDTKGGAVELRGGSLTVLSDIRLNRYGLAWGRFEVVNGHLSAGNILIGSTRYCYPSLLAVLPPAGRFRQTGGTVAVGNNTGGTGLLSVGLQDMHITDAAGSRLCWASATYELLGGLLATRRTEVGVGGVGRFVQGGGVHNVHGGLVVGGAKYFITGASASLASDMTAASLWTADHGTYQLMKGTLTAGSAHVGQWGRGLFIQSGGAASIEGALSVGGDWWWPCDATTSVLPPWRSGSGAYVLCEGELKTLQTRIGGNGRFVQSGGRHAVAGTLRIGVPYWTILDDGTTLASDPAGCIWPLPVPGKSSYTLSGGRLEAGGICVGGTGGAMLSQTGGRLDVAGTVEIAGPAATWSFERGQAVAGRVQVGALTNTAPANLPDGTLSLGGKCAELTIRGSLAFGAGSALKAVAGSTVNMVGAHLKNFSRNPAALAGLDSVRMVFTAGASSGAASWSTYEVAGKDLGPVRAGWWQNFQMHTLQIGANVPGWLKLVDEFDNRIGYDEALYVRYFHMTPCSKLDLNGLRLYYLDGWIPDTAEVLGGLAEKVDASAWALTGDIDFDGSVGRGDLERLANGMGCTDAKAADGDLNGDGSVDASDFIMLKLNFGKSLPEVAAPTGAVNVPEPAALVVVMAAGLPALLKRRRRRS